MGRRHLGRVDHPLEIGLQKVLDILRAVLDEGLWQKEACIVDQHINMAEGLDARLKDAFGGSRRGDIACHTDKTLWIAKFAAGLGQAGLGAGIAYHVEVVGEEGLDQAEADAAGGTGNSNGSASSQGVLLKGLKAFSAQVKGGALLGGTIFLLDELINRVFITSIDTWCN
jgi:hypothetical protein